MLLTAITTAGVYGAAPEPTYRPASCALRSTQRSA